ncbi:hypothetical protein SeMB42_g01984 [Synchytrium endobioticum]|uniref:BTB domain-containing protein n=1 Tax=Synchytrium endobioticum TaxID=286115 RepID=A0A507DIG8_9FUNG|nr:hypothetical protein SeMB42_g01984 [Synchytrium endobioticum]
MSKDTGASPPHDLVFVVNGLQFTAHIPLLAEQSPCFLRLWQNQTAANGQDHHPTDTDTDTDSYSFLPISWPPSPGRPARIRLPLFISGDSVETFLTYMYTLRYSPPNPSDPPSPVRTSEKKEIMYSVSIPPALRTPPRILVELYTLAKCYEVTELSNLVAKDLVKRMDSATVWEILHCAATCGPDANHIKTMAEVYIKKHSLSTAGMMLADNYAPFLRSRIDRRPTKRVARSPGDDVDEVII